jgi:hypothetical protein
MGHDGCLIASVRHDLRGNRALSAVARSMQHVDKRLPIRIGKVDEPHLQGTSLGRFDQ